MVSSAEKKKFETIFNSAHKMKNIPFIIVSSLNSAGMYAIYNDWIYLYHINSLTFFSNGF